MRGLDLRAVGLKTLGVAALLAGGATASHAQAPAPLPQIAPPPQILTPAPNDTPAIEPASDVPDILRRPEPNIAAEPAQPSIAGEPVGAAQTQPAAPPEAAPQPRNDGSNTGFWASIGRFLFGGEEQAELPRAPEVPRGGSDIDLFGFAATVGFVGEQEEVDETTGEVVVTLRRSVYLDREVVVRVRSQDDSATGGQDYGVVDQLVVFPPGASTATARIEIRDDDVFEGPEILILRLESEDVALAEIDPARAMMRIRIISDDPEPDTGPAPAPDLVLLPDQGLTIAETPIGQQNAGRARIGNEGNAPLRVVRVDVEGAGFALLDDRCSGTEIAGGAGFCDLDIAFTPTAPGRASGRLRVTTNDREATIAIEAFGFAVAQPVFNPVTAAAERLRAERDFAGAGAVVQLYEPAEAVQQAPEYVISEPDYRATGFTPAFFTFPVDRRFAITTDRFISCVLETAINSQLPGFVICVVENHVYGADGRFVLIPAGTRIEGDYQPLAAVGDTRLNVVWRRFFRPDGSSFYVESGFQAQDAMGQAGVPGEVDNRWFERFGAPLLLTAVASGVQFAADASSDTATTTSTTAGSAGSTTTQSAASSAAETLAEGLGEVALKLLDETVDLRPRMFVAAGTRITIKPLVDMWFKTPQVLGPGQAAPPVAPGTQMVAFPPPGRVNPPIPGDRFQTPRPGQ